MLECWESGKVYAAMSRQEKPGAESGLDAGLFHRETFPYHQQTELTTHCQCTEYVCSPIPCKVRFSYPLPYMKMMDMSFNPEWWESHQRFAYKFSLIASACHWVSHKHASGSSWESVHACCSKLHQWWTNTKEEEEEARRLVLPWGRTPVNKLKRVSVCVCVTLQESFFVLFWSDCQTVLSCRLLMLFIIQNCWGVFSVFIHLHSHIDE